MLLLLLLLLLLDGFLLFDSANRRRGLGPDALVFKVRDCSPGGGLASGLLGREERVQGAKGGRVAVDGEEAGEAGAGSVVGICWLWGRD